MSPASSRLSSLPLVSLVTPSFNQAAFIERTLLSVQAQDYPRIEHIVIDGASTDRTGDVLRRYAARVRVISEPDGGQADAINKGFRLAQGEIFAWLNADDLLLPGAISAVVRFFQANPHISFVYGDVLAINAQDRTYGIRAHVRQTDYDDLLTNGDFIVQPAAFWRASLWREVGELDTTLHYTMDYEYWLRAAQRTTLRYIPVVLAAERLHGGAKTARGSLARMREIEALARRYGSPGLSSSYRPQAAAQLALQGLSRCLRREKGGVEDIRAALRLRPQPAVFLRYFGVMLLAGEGALTRYWLLINLLRQRRKAGTVLPTDFIPR
jgi:glycosyltransferase involved in cell wall biosynthesis